MGVESCSAPHYYGAEIVSGGLFVLLNLRASQALKCTTVEGILYTVRYLEYRARLHLVSPRVDALDLMAH